MGIEKIIVVGIDHRQTVERRFRVAGYGMVSAANRETALSQGSLINVTETALTLRDLCPKLKIVVLLQRGTKHSNRFLRQLLGHPIEGSQVMTRRELQRHLRVR